MKEKRGILEDIASTFQVWGSNCCTHQYGGGPTMHTPIPIFGFPKFHFFFILFVFQHVCGGWNINVDDARWFGYHIREKI